MFTYTWKTWIYYIHLLGHLRCSTSILHRVKKHGRPTCRKSSQGPRDQWLKWLKLWMGKPNATIPKSTMFIAGIDHTPYSKSRPLYFLNVLYNLYPFNIYICIYINNNWLYHNWLFPRQRPDSARSAPQGHLLQDHEEDETVIRSRYKAQSTQDVQGQRLPKRCPVDVSMLGGPWELRNTWEMDGLNMLKPP